MKGTLLVLCLLCLLIYPLTSIAVRRHFYPSFPDQRDENDANYPESDPRSEPHRSETKSHRSYIESRHSSSQAEPHRSDTESRHSSQVRTEDSHTRHRHHHHHHHHDGCHSSFVLHYVGACHCSKSDEEIDEEGGSFECQLFATSQLIHTHVYLRGLASTHVINLLGGIASFHNNATVGKKGHLKDTATLAFGSHAKLNSLKAKGEGYYFSHFPASCFLAGYNVTDGLGEQNGISGLITMWACKDPHHHPSLESIEPEKRSQIPPQEMEKYEDIAKRGGVYVKGVLSGIFFTKKDGDLHRECKSYFGEEELIVGN